MIGGGKLMIMGAAVFGAGRGWTLRKYGGVGTRGSYGKSPGGGRRARPYGGGAGIWEYWADYENVLFPRISTHRLFTLFDLASVLRSGASVGATAGG